ncbi:myosin light chain kinase 3-like isoform X2 [Xyrauchen texanus]|uniref:myosin light chain kinase 3-like isoform X2 n=1 Tax=Xyrauchen texanus TaxID=154827 RepID=UPI00224253C0|nr:myosin light chain kinase 3-like isoform X2 [Xyrauchen texanus]
MDCFLKGRDIWIVGSVWLMAFYLWHRFWDLFSSRRKAKSSSSTNGQLNDHKNKDGKFHLSIKGLKAQKKKKPPDSTVSLRKQALLLEEIQKLNQENAECSEGTQHLEADVQKSDNGLLTLIQQDLMLEDTKAPTPEEKSYSEEQKEVTMELKVTEQKTGGIQSESPQLLEVEGKEWPQKMHSYILKDQEIEDKEDQKADVDPSETNITNTECPTPPENSLQRSEPEQVDEVTTSSKRRVTEEDLGLEDHKKSRVEEGQEDAEQQPEESEDLCGVFKAEGVEIELDLSQIKKDSYEDEDEDNSEHFYIDCTPPPPAPFSHRIVSSKPNQINNFYTINRQEILGGGRFGQVHKCIENSSGLTLAAKIIKARSQKEKEVVKNEIQVMNQLDHANLIQLYAAYESRNDMILVLEYVNGGELFDRIIDENYTLMELDTVMFIRQICEGLQYMHKMYILHLDLKPENILCVSRLTNKIKIIDFGLARKYQPREKLRVNFGTPEFLAPEVINYDFVSFNTDMWSLGVITYMLLSGLSPFLGDDDNQTLNNILVCQWNFEEDEFRDISEEAKDFISKVLIIDKSWRIGASEALRHPWLSDPTVHFRLHEKKNMCRSRRNSCVPPPES